MNRTRISERELRIAYLINVYNLQLDQGVATGITGSRICDAYTLS